MPRLRNKITGVQVSVSEEKAVRLGSDWAAADSQPKETPAEEVPAVEPPAPAKAAEKPPAPAPAPAKAAEPAPKKDGDKK